MLTEETAKLLIEAANRLSAAIERATGMNALGGGIHIYHHGAPASPVTPPYPNVWGPSSIGGGTGQPWSGGYNWQ